MANINGKRSAVSQLIFKCAGVLACLLILPYLLSFIKDLSSSPAQQIALGHLFVNLASVILFFFILKPFASVMIKVLPGQDEELPLWPEYLHQRDLVNPYRSLAGVHKELQRQFVLAKRMYASTRRLLADYQEIERKNIAYTGMVVSNLRLQIVSFLLKISARPLSVAHSRKLFVYTAMAGDIQSIAKHVEAMSRLTAQKAERRIPFSSCGEDELYEIMERVGQNIDDALCLSGQEETGRMQSVFRAEEEIDALVKQARDNHLQRFHNRECRAEAGPVFVEMLIHLERISDHCNNIAEYAGELKT